MQFMKRLPVNGDYPSIEESDTKRLSPDVSRGLTFSLVTSFECKIEEVVLCCVYQVQKKEYNIFKCTSEMQRLQK